MGMIDRRTAIEMKAAALDAIRALSKLAKIGSENISETDFSEMKRFIGMTIGELDENVLTVIYRQHPDLDDLKG